MATETRPREQRAGEDTCQHPTIEKEFFHGAHTGDYLCARCGRAFTAAELAGWAGTIPWEVLTNINHRVKRVYLGGHAA